MTLTFHHLASKPLRQLGKVSEPSLLALTCFVVLLVLYRPGSDHITSQFIDDLVRVLEFLAK